MSLRFAILGPLEVYGAAGPVRLGGPRTRALLAALLLERNRPVSADRLAGALWGDDTEYRASSAVRVQISRLRTLLDSPDALTTVPAGYQLNVAEDALDADRFAALVAEARSLAPAPAAGRLHAALSLW